MTLDAVPLPRRCGAALNVIASSPGLSIMERCEVLAVALWPPGEAAVPATSVGDRAHSTAQERADAVALRRSGVSEAEVAARYCVARSTVKMWVHAAKRAGG